MMIQIKSSQVQKAGKKQAAYYENFLYPFQDQIFALIQTDEFYLGGGTCLSRFYYNHRYSDDLDFFFNGYDFPRENFHIITQEVVNRISDHYKIDIQINGEYFKRMIVYKDNKPLKLEFIFENYKCPGNRSKQNHIWIDSKENIATNKITAIYDRHTVKDYVDLYYLLPEFQFEQLEQWALEKVVPMEYEGVLITFAIQVLEGSVTMIDDIAIHDINAFIKNMTTQVYQYARQHSKTTS